MHITRGGARSPLLILLPLLLWFPVAEAQENAQKTPLSEKLRLIIDEDGAKAARQWFEEVYPEERDQYEADVEGGMTLGSEYMAAGDFESGSLVIEAVITASQDAVPTAGMLPSATAASGENPPVEVSEQAAPAWVEPEARTDLARFFGLYGEPGQLEPVRGLIVTELCGGILYVTTTWGDSSPWLMNPVSEARFEYADSWISFWLEFQPGAGSAESVAHDLDFLPSPLARLGPLPEGWGECVPDWRG